MSKRDVLLSLLQTGWVPVEELVEVTGWKPHSLRAFISVTNKAGGKIERQRIDGVTSYRIAPND